MDASGVIKVADFGLSENIYTRTYYRQKKNDTSVKLPVRWMPPESIADGMFTEKSDVVSATNTTGMMHARTCNLYFNILYSGHLESHVGRCLLGVTFLTVESAQ